MKLATHVRRVQINSPDPILFAVNSIKKDSCAKIVFVFNTAILGGGFLLNGFWRERHRKDGCLCVLMIGKIVSVCRKARVRLHVAS